MPMINRYATTWQSPSIPLRKVTSFDSAGNVTRELVVDHVTKIDTARNEIDFINSVQYAPGKNIGRLLDR